MFQKLKTLKSKILFLMVPGLISSPVLAVEQCGNGDRKIAIGVGCTNSGNAIFDYLKGIIKFVGGAVGLVIVLVIIIAGIRYITSQGNPQGVAAAIKLLLAGVIGLIAFAFAAAILQWLIPGGLF